MNRQRDTFIHDGGLGHFDEECGVVGTLGVAVKGGDLRAFLGPHFDSPITTGRHDAAILFGAPILTLYPTEVMEAM